VIRYVIFALPLKTAGRMTEDGELIAAIESKVHQLIERLQTLQADNTTLKNENQVLSKIKGDQQETIEQLTQKTNAAYTAKIVERKEGTVEAKARINELLREIDKCIGLLNS